MKLKIKNFKWLAGRPVVILHEETAKKMNVFVDNKVSIKNTDTTYAVVDIFSKIVDKNEIGLSQEMSQILKLKNGTFVYVNPSDNSNSASLIKDKIEGERLNDKELEYLISEIVSNNLTEAEIAYFITAQKFSGMSIKETIGLTKAMIKTGTILNFKGKYIADKHCIGGVAGNRTTPIIVSICASAGLTIPKTSSRAITSAFGTADVIETISNVELSLKKMKKVVNKTGACLIWGGSLDLAPSDDKIIRVERELGVDVESQLLASIISKKISVGSKYLIIDIPYGESSKINSLKNAKRLGMKFKQLAKSFRLKLKIFYTNGRQPIGNGFGPVLEMLDILSVLENSPNAPKDLKEKSLYLSSGLMSLCNIKNAKSKAKEILSSGKAYKKFKEIIEAQNEKKNFYKKIKELKLARINKTILAEKSGKIVSISNSGINSLCKILGTPETISAGVYLHKHLERVKKAEPILTFYTESNIKMKEAEEFLKRNKVIKIK